MSCSTQKSITKASPRTEVLQIRQAERERVSVRAGHRAPKTRKAFAVSCCARISTDDFQLTFRNPALGSSNGENNARKTFFLPHPVSIRPGANLFISSDGRSARLIARPSISENRRPVSPS